MEPLSQEAANFPLAFSILMYKDVFQVERLLRAIYMPQNYYCIHVKQSDQLQTASPMSLWLPGSTPSTGGT